MEYAFKNLENAAEMRRWLKEVVNDFLDGDGEDLEIKLKVNGRTLELTDSCEEVGLIEEMLDKVVRLRYEWLEEYL